MDRRYCSHPLTMERETDLNQFFDDIDAKVVSSEVERRSKNRDRLSFWTTLNKLHE